MMNRAVLAFAALAIVLGLGPWAFIFWVVWRNTRPGKPWWPEERD